MCDEWRREGFRGDAEGDGRPGIGEKMFGSPGDDDGDNGDGMRRELQPPFGLTRIDASPI